MSWESSQSPDLAWQDAGRLPRGTTESDLNGGNRSVLIQDEPRVRIVFSAAGDTVERLVSKIYRTPLSLTWRDLFRYPQAQREFENLQYAFKKKLPVAKPLGFGLRRVPGRDWFSQLTTAFLEGSTLRSLLNASGTSRESGEGLLSGAGRLVAAMHKRGVVWGTAHSGNFMVNTASGNTMTAFDLPYALCTGRSMVGSRLALYDVWNMAVDFRTQYQLDPTLFDSFFEAYGDATGSDWKSLRSQVDARVSRKDVFWERIYIRTVRSFRLRPF